MLVLLVAFLVQGLLDRWPVHKIRTWIALFASSIAALIASHHVADWDGLMRSYILIDGLAAWVVLIRPAGAAQRAIGLCYFVMILSHIGLVGASLGGRVDTASYDSLQGALGWAQFAILCLWSAWDVGKAIVHRLWPDRLVVAPETLGGAD